MIFKAPKDPCFWMIDNRDGTTYPCDESGIIVARHEWASMRFRIDAFYENATDSEINEFNQDTLRLAREQQAQSSESEKRKTVAPECGYVYLIHGIGTHWYKIGLSDNPKIRIKQLGTQSPFRLELLHATYTHDMVETESHFHRLFASKRAEGEWFTLSQSDIDIFCGWSGL